MTQTAATAGSPAAAAPHAAGETDLARLLAGLAPTLAPRPRAIRTQANDAPVPANAIMLFREDEGVTVVVEPGEDDAAQVNELRWAQITLRIHSSLDAVGMMAAIAATLAKRNIPCNAVSAYFHDHLFVPWAQRRRAVAALEDLARKQGDPEDSERRVEYIARKYRIDAEPSMVDEYAHLTNEQRAARFLKLRRQSIEKHYGPDQRFERVCAVARRP